MGLIDHSVGTGWFADTFQSKKKPDSEHRLDFDKKHSQSSSLLLRIGLDVESGPAGSPKPAECRISAGLYKSIKY
jgi:hypothetical protein